MAAALRRHRLLRVFAVLIWACGAAAAFGLGRRGLFASAPPAAAPLAPALRPGRIIIAASGTPAFPAAAASAPAAPSAPRWYPVLGCLAAAAGALAAARRPQALLGAAGDGDAAASYDLRDLVGGKAGVLLFQWNRAALDLRAQGFQPKTEVLGDRAVRLKSLCEEFPKLVAKAKVLSLAEQGSASFDKLEGPLASEGERLSRTRIVAALSAGQGSALAFVSTWEDHVSIDSCVINPSYMAASEDAEIALIRHVAEEAAAAGCESVRYRPYCEEACPVGFYEKSGFFPADDGATDGTLSFRKTVAALSVAGLDRDAAQKLDEDLMSAEGGFSLDQLMELAGLSVAAAVAEEYPAATHPKVVLVCGPGNNGGDGLVAARHLFQFGFSPTVYYPKPGGAEIFARLQVQLGQLGIPIVTDLPNFAEFDVVVDALFGFSFAGWRGDVPYDAWLNPPFDMAVLKMAGLKSGKPALVSVDIPSGWDTEVGPFFPPEAGAGATVGKPLPEASHCLRPQVLVSLTAPKNGVKDFEGVHYVGGRFVPPPIAERYGLARLPYAGASQIARL